MRVDFGCCDAGVTQDRLQTAHIDFAVLIHQGRGCMPELMRRYFFRIQPGLNNVFPNEMLNRFRADPSPEPTDKQSIVIFCSWFLAVGEVAHQSIQTGTVQVDRSLFAAFSDNSQRLLFD